MSEVDTAPTPMKELAFILGKFGWNTRFSDLTEEQVQTTANDIINQQIENTKREILFGSASVIIESEEVMSIGFKNSNADPEDVNKILDLFELNEETIH